MATLILDYSTPVTLACIIAIVTTVATLGLVTGIAALVDAVQARRPRRPRRFVGACHAREGGHPVSTASLLSCRAG